MATFTSNIPMIVNNISTMKDVSAQNIELSGNLFVSGSSTFSESLDVSGDVVVDGTLDVSGDVRFGDRLDVSGDVVVDGSLDVSGTTLRGDLNMDTNRIDRVSRVIGTIYADGPYITSRANGTNEGIKFTNDGSPGYPQHTKTMMEMLPVDNRIKSYLPLDVDGNVGIGGGHSSEKLKVYGDVNITGNIVVDGSFSFSEVVQNTTTVNNTLLVSTQLDISNEGTGPALKVSQLGDGDDQDVALFNAGDEGNALKIDSSGNTFVYKGVDISGHTTLNDVSCNGNVDIFGGSVNISNDINMGGSIITDNGVYTNYKIPVIVDQLSPGAVFLLCLKDGGDNECVGRMYYQRSSGHDGSGIVDIVVSSRQTSGDLPNGFCSYQTNQEHPSSTNTPNRYSIISGTYSGEDFIGLKYEGGFDFPFGDVYFDGILKTTGTNDPFQMISNSQFTNQVELELNNAELSLLNKSLVINDEGNTTIAGTLGVTGGITGNTTIAGTLGVTGGITGNITGNLTGNINGSTTINGDTYINNNQSEGSPLVVENKRLNGSCHIDIKNVSRSQVLGQSGGWYRLFTAGGNRSSNDNGNFHIKQYNGKTSAFIRNALTIDKTGNTTVGNTLFIGTNDNSETPKTIKFGGTIRDNSYEHSVIETRVYGATEKSELLLFKGNDTATIDGPDRIRLRAAQIDFDTYPSVTSDRTAENIRMSIKDNGNVGIGTTTPSTTLDVNGTLGVTGGTTIDGGLEVGGSATIDGGLEVGGGNIGIGTSNPQARLHIKESVTSGGNQEPGNAIRIENVLGDTWQIGVDNESSGSELSFKNIGTNAVWYLVGNIGGGGAITSDDRIKHYEQFIENATSTLLKMRPQIYRKSISITDAIDGDNMIIQSSSRILKMPLESGVIAQELYYDVPEVRHLIRLPKTADLSNIDVIPQGYVEHYDDPSIDPNYSAWGNDVARVNYTGLIPYLIQGFKEQQDIINEEKERNQTQYNELLSRIQALETTTESTS